MAGVISSDRKIEAGDGLADAQLERRPLEIVQTASQHRCQIDGLRCWDCGNAIEKRSIYVASESTISKGLRSTSKTVEAHPECYDVALEAVRTLGAASVHSWEIGRWPLHAIWAKHKATIATMSPTLAAQLSEAFGNRIPKW